MSLSSLCIRRPVGTTLLSLGLALGGVLSFMRLPVAALPQVDTPTLVVSTLLPGASGATMAATVTTPLERQLGQVPGLAQLTSVSSEGSSQITVQFVLERSMAAAEQDVQAALSAASSLLPSTLPAPPTYSKSNPADMPILTLAVSSAVLPLRRLSDYADSILAQKLSQVAGVGLVSVGGGQKPAVRVQADPQALAALQLTLEDVRQALAAANVNQPKGSLDGPQQAATLDTDDQLYDADAFGRLVIGYVGGAPIRLRDVAQVVDGVENRQLAGWANGKRAILLSIYRQPGANVIAVTDRLKQVLKNLTGGLPHGAEVLVLSDRTTTVRASLRDVQGTLLLTLGLVVLTMALFLRSARATLIPAVAVPMSWLITAMAMDALDFSLNNLTLMALTISTGFVVDDAIVMVENIQRYIEAGKAPRQAALSGAAEIAFTILSLTLSLIAVLIPLLLMGGIVGRLFREFAVTLSLCIAASALVSLTLTPMMCAAWLTAKQEAPPPAWSRAFERAFAAVLAAYGRSLAPVLRHPRRMLAVAGLTLALTVGLAMRIPKGFFPLQDTGLLVGTTQMDDAISFAAMSRAQMRVAQRLLADPEVATVASSIGSDGQNATQSAGHLAIGLAPSEARRSSLPQLLARLQQGVAELPGTRLFLQPVQDLQVDSRTSRAPYQYILQGPVDADLRSALPRLWGALRRLPELRDVASEQLGVGQALQVEVDRDAAMRLGVSQQAIDDVLYDAFGQRIVSTIFTQLNQYRVILEVDPRQAQDAAALQRLWFPSQSGAPVPLQAFAAAHLTPAPQAISHQGQFPAASLSFDLAPGVALGQAVAAIEACVQRLELPASLGGAFVGSAQAFSEALAGEPSLIVAALLAVYIVLGVLYESTLHPLTILSTLPSAGLGALLALWGCGAEFDVVALIGIVLLIGIVKKNAIMMVDFAIAARRDPQVGAHEAIHAACMLRFRPIMMTTFAALMGGLPLALGQGMGAELRRPLGISIVGGLLVSQVLTLYTTPVIYLYVDRLARRLQRPAPKTCPAA